MSPEPLASGTGLLAWAWQVGLHSFVTGLVFFAWSRHLGLPPGAARRRILEVVLVLPLFTASIPGRTAPAFRDGLAWFDGARVLDLPLGVGDLRVVHLFLLMALATAVLTLVQEILPAFRRPRISEEAGDVPVEASEKEAWDEASVELVVEEGLLAGLGGSPDHPRLLLSADLVEALDGEALRMVIRHEKAHLRRAHWYGQHLLFAARLVQFFNPVALWVFREYCVEVEIECDRRAVRGEDPRPLVRALLALYDETDPRDVASRGVLRRRVDILLGRRPVGGGELPLASLLAASSILALLLPWLV